MEIFLRLDASGKLRAYGPPLKTLDRQLLDRINSYANCGMLGLASGKLIGTGVATLWAGGGGFVPLTLGSLGLLGSMYACSESEAGGEDLENRSGCQYTPKGGFPTVSQSTGTGGCGFTGYEWTEIVDLQKRPSGVSDDYMEFRVVALNLDGTQQVASPEWQLREATATFSVRPKEGDKCGREASEGLPLPPDATQPITYTDSETNCTYNIQLQGFAESFQGGPQAPVWLIEQAQTLRTSGGLIGGCNFQPTLYYDDSGGGPGGPTIPPIPVPPGGDGPDWPKLLQNALAGAAGNLLASAIKDLLDPKLEPAEFEFVAPCNYRSDGKNESVIYELPEQSYQDRVVSQQAVLMEIMQQHLNWKTPICSGHAGKGDYRTISFISVESSPYGDGRLRKRFRYRSQSGIGLDGVVDHWKDFAFDAGDVCVQHRGSALGSPQVWAASVDEGKRVILHAAREAGVDPNQVGEWTIGGSDNPRYGVFGRMIVNTKGGYYWITSRLGENNRPLVVKT